VLTQRPRPPATLDNVERVASLTPDELDRRYVRRGVPVILTDMFDGAPVERLADPAVAVSELGDLRLPVRINPIPEYLHGRPAPRVRTTSFADFYDDLAVGASDEFCIEHDTPEPLLAYVPEPDHLGVNDPGDGWASHMFLAGPGRSTHLHFDVDMRANLTHQVFGRKRFVLVDPRQVRKLAPGAPPEACYASALHLDHFSPADLDAFLRYVDAWDCVLEPGETLLTPATTWHYIEYLDVALSVTLRMSRNRYLQFLAEALPTMSVEVQALAGCFRDEDAIGLAEADAFARLHAEVTRPRRSLRARAAAVDRLCVQLCEELDLPVAQSPYHLADIRRRDRMAGAPVATDGLGGEVGWRERVVRSRTRSRRSGPAT
jgi:hypothetical protein